MKVHVIDASVAVKWFLPDAPDEANIDHALELMLAGQGGVITVIFPATNALASATEFEIAPEELFRIFRAMRAAELEHLGIYHSHPRGPTAPSAKDVERAFYPEAAYFVIWGEVRAFVIRDGKVDELEIKVG